MKSLCVEHTVRPFTPRIHSVADVPDLETWLASEEQVAEILSHVHHCSHETEGRAATCCEECARREAWAAAGFPSHWPSKPAEIAPPHPRRRD